MAGDVLVSTPNLMLIATGISKSPFVKRLLKICLVIYDPTSHCPILLQFGKLMHYGSAEAAEWLKYKMVDGIQIGN